MSGLFLAAKEVGISGINLDTDSIFLTAFGVDNAPILNFRHDAARFISLRLSGTKPRWLPGRCRPTVFMMSLWFFAVEKTRELHFSNKNGLNNMMRASSGKSLDTIRQGTGNWYGMPGVGEEECFRIWISQYTVG